MERLGPLGGAAITGLQLYSSRCALFHTYTVESDLTRSGTRKISVTEFVKAKDDRAIGAVAEPLASPFETGWARAWFVGANYVIR